MNIQMTNDVTSMPNEQGASTDAPSALGEIFSNVIQHANSNQVNNDASKVDEVKVVKKEHKAAGKDQKNVQNMILNSQLLTDIIPNIKNLPNKNFAEQDEITPALESTKHLAQDAQALQKKLAITPNADSVLENEFNSINSEVKNANQMISLNNNKLEGKLADSKIIDAKSVNAKLPTNEASLLPQLTTNIMKNDIETQPAQPILEPPTLNIDAKVQQDKIADAFTQLGDVIQHQVSEAIANPAALPNGLTTSTNSFSSVQAAMSASRNNEDEINLQLPVESTIPQIQQALETNIKIYPPELGTVLAKLKVDKNSAQLFIVTENSQVKNIVEANLPQLRDHFQQSHLTLTHVQVDAAGSNNQGDNMNKQYKTGEFKSDSQIDSPNNKPVTTSSDENKNSDKIIDTYA